MKRPQNPCRYCTKHTGCTHTGCGEYDKFVIANELFNQEIRKAKGLNSYCEINQRVRTSIKACGK